MNTNKNGHKAEDEEIETTSIEDRFKEKLSPEAGYIIRDGKIILLKDLEEEQDGLS